MAGESEDRQSETSGIDRIAVFSRAREFDKAHALLSRLELPFAVLSPDPGYARVGTPALLCDPDGTSAILSDRTISCAGWADNFEPPTVIPQQSPENFDENVFGDAAIMFFGPCMADETRVRLTVHLGGNLAPVLPYVNRTMPQACFNTDPCSLTFMEGARMVSLYPQRIAIGKADGLVDAWRTLEKIRLLVNRTWAQKDSIVPLYERRFKPPALEIYKRLPKTNCRVCGEQTCMAFAVSLWQGRAVPSQCAPAFTEEHAALGAALLEICQGLGVDTTGVGR